MGTSREEFFCGLQKPQLALRGRDGVHLSVAFKPIRRIIRVQDSAKDGGEIGFLPDLRGRIVPIDPLAFSRTSYGCNTPFAAEIDDIGVNPSRNLHIDTNINARKSIETAKIVVSIASEMQNSRPRTSNIHSELSMLAPWRTKPRNLRTSRSRS